MNYQAHALRYHAWGANVTAICNRNKHKAAAHTWKQWQTARQTAADVRRLPWQSYTARSGELVTITGVGVINGIGDWRTLDLDKCTGYEPVAELLAALGLPADYPWVTRTGSGNGWHVDLRCTGPLPPGVFAAKEREPGVFVGPSRSGAFEHAELRWERCQTIKPPSQHASGDAYRWHNTPPAGPPALVALAALVAGWQQIVLPPELPTAAQGAADDGGAVAVPYDRTALAEIRERFDLLAYAQRHFSGEAEEIGDEVKIHGNGGLYIDPARQRWYCHLAELGGDCIDLVGYSRYKERWNHQDPLMFVEALREAAHVTGVSLPARPTRRNDHTAAAAQAGAGPGAGGDPDAAAAAAAPSGPSGANTAASEAILAEIQAAADRTAVADLLPELTARCAALDRNTLLRVDRALARRGLPGEQVRAWHSALNEVRKARRQQAQHAAAIGPVQPIHPRRLADFYDWVSAMLNQKDAGRTAREEVGRVLRDFLLAQGQLLYETRTNDAERTPYLLTGDYRTIVLDPRGNLPLEATLARTGLNASEPAWAWTVKELISAAYNSGRAVAMHKFGFTDLAAQKIYISCGTDGYVVAQPGQPLTYKRNSEDGIIFRSTAVYPRWDWQAEPQDFRQLAGFRPPLLWPAEAPRYTPEVQYALLDTFLVGAFIGQRPLPLCMLVGGKGGGKSTTGRAIMKYFLGPEAALGTLSNDPRDFSVRAITEVVTTFDNLDTPPEDWALDAIAACITGVAKIERVLYSNTGLLNVVMDTALLVTTRTAPFERPDIIERILPVFTGDPGDDGRISETDIYAQINHARSGLFVYMAQLAAKMLTYIAATPAGLPGRFVDFNRLIYAYLAAYGAEDRAAAMLTAWRKAQMLGIGDPDPFLKAIIEHLPPAGFQRVAASELVQRLSAACKDAGEQPLPFLGGGKAIARQLRELSSALAQLDVQLSEDIDASHERAVFTLARARTRAS